MKRPLRSVTIEEMREIQQSILKRIDTICRNHGLRYFLGGGTLLGAIRHKGYIPWDDDVDVIMPRKDYMNFLDIASRDLDENYVLTSPYHNDAHVYTFSKIYDRRTLLLEPGYPDIGVYVDLFPMDGMPGDRAASRGHFRKVKILNLLLNAAISRRSITNKPSINFIKGILHPFCRLIGIQRLLHLIDQNALKYDYETSDFVGVAVMGIYGERECMDKHIFSSTEKTLFENELFPIPGGYDEYLSNLYGDYMKLPPKEKQVTHHSYTVYWKNQPW